MDNLQINSPDIGIKAEELPLFLREFSAYHFRVRFVAQKDVEFKGKWYFLPRFALGNALKNSKTFSHLYSDLFKPEGTRGEEEKASTISSRLVIRADKPNRHRIARREPLDLYITIVAKDAAPVDEFLRFLPEWQEYNFFHENRFSYHSYQLLNPITDKYQTDLKAENARLDIHFFLKHVPKWEDILTIRFLSPTTLKIDHILTDAIPYSRLVNRVSRRLYDLYRHYLLTDESMQVEPYIFPDRDDLLLSQVSMPRKSTIKENRHYDMSGVLGQLHYRTPYHPVAAVMLAVAHWVHIGTHTVSGNGQVKAEAENSLLYQKWISLISKDPDFPLKGPEQESLIEALKSLSYTPDAYRSIKIPKSDGTHRELNIPSPLDMYLQKKLVEIVSSVMDKLFMHQSYAYRKGKGAVEAIKRVEKIQKTLDDKHYIIRCDIDDFFASIPLESLMEQIQDCIHDPLLLRMMSLWLKSGVADKKAGFYQNTKGLPQGSPLSPLLSNFYLHSWDKYIDQNITKYFVRYADDILLFIPDSRDPLAVLQSLSDHLRNHKKLCLNKDFLVVRKDTEFSFLGIAFNPDGSKGMSKSKKDRIERKIAEALYRDPIEFKTLEKAIEGIKNYYQKFVKTDDIEVIDEKAASVYASFIESIKDPTKKKSITEKLLDIGFLINKRSKALIKKAIKKKADTTTQTVLKSRNEEEVLRKQFKKHLQMQEDTFELVISEPGAFIGVSRNNIVVRKFGRVIDKHPLSCIEQISIICKGVSFSSNVTSFCHKKNIRIVYYNAIGEAYVSVNSVNSILPSIMKAQMELDENKIRSFIIDLVRNKIKNQTKLLKYYHKYFRKNKNLSAPFYQSIDKLEDLQKTTISGSTISEFRQSAMLLEAQAAKLYWSSFALLIQRAGYSFEGRVQQGASDLVNQMLNYGYAILQSYVMRTIDLWQLNPNIGILHTPQDNKPALCFDLMEQYRSFIVDRSILALLSKGEEVKQDKTGLLNMATRTRIISKIKERWFALEYFRSGEKIFSEIMKIQTRDVRDYCTGKIKKVKFYTPKW
ncbi:MAG: CRISPR-associated endonuclease Cas1 [Porphyromonas sp.]|nr:CRISPR-associated endonuclease Cas1 [Porphyromonas sp.]